MLFSKNPIVYIENSKEGGRGLLYDKVLKYCRENRISLSAFEKECGLGNATIKGWKNSNPRIDSLQKVAKRMGVSIEELLAEEGA